MNEGECHLDVQDVLVYYLSNVVSMNRTLLLNE